MDKLQAYVAMRKSGGKVFTVTFIKKDGTERVMNCRTEVTKHLKGGELKFDPLARLMMVVFDMQKGEYRMVNLETVKQLKIDGNVYEVR